MLHLQWEITGSTVTNKLENNEGSLDTNFTVFSDLDVTLKL